MAGNSFGQLFCLTSFGESHGVSLGGIIDGCPAGIELTEQIIQLELDKRKPGSGGVAVTNRQESDKVSILSGVFEGKTTGTSIGFLIPNKDHRSSDYEKLKDVFRPGHADFTYTEKYGFRDYRGGGRSSGRETVSRVVGGAIAQEFLKTIGVCVQARTVEIGGIACSKTGVGTDDNLMFADDPAIVPHWEKRLLEVKSQGDTLGGVVEIRAYGIPIGLGEPVFDKLDARLAYALMGIGAVKGVSIGAGFEASRLTGKQNNDILEKDGFKTNNAGGILGGISNGNTIICRAHIKPIPSVSVQQDMFMINGENIKFAIPGRHDICAIPRIVPVLKAMVLLTLADMYLCSLGNKIPRI